MELHDGENLLVSACLLGEPCRYDGSSQPCASVIALSSIHKLIPVCPELLGGLATPRPPAEIQPSGRVINKIGDDVTEAYAQGAQIAVDIARSEGCRAAILKSKSPSCGAYEIYDGSFNGTLLPGQGMAAAALRAAGIVVTDENRLFA